MKKSKFILRFGAMMLAVTIFMPSISWAQEPLPDLGQAKIFVYVPGAEGSSTDMEHEGWIEAIGYSGQIDMPVPNSPAQSGQRASGTANFDQIPILKGIDQATTGLMKMACNGRPIYEDVIIHIAHTKENGQTQVSLMITLSEVIIANHKHEWKEGSAVGIVESVRLDYAKIVMHYYAFDSYGQPTTDGRSGWDLQKNQES